ncbi:hypothetical protein GGR88_002145 [Sphingomonas jejuensis]|jgi:hypothetical protein|uniref:Uncharacterized protein n=1 Tax=Sphingomonas jejuensis TaxID=904715 RepID=A0ABX0XMN4_9SPHN|nr:hypothetical protein [Sphingomonas jejuensis]NJC34631.1 hypothetical protein [Sphingomonas jejuensis]
MADDHNKQDPDESTMPGRQDAGHDRSITERLRRSPDDADAKLDRGSDESMDASDPPSVTAPGHDEPAESSGYDEDAERGGAA